MANGISKFLSVLKLSDDDDEFDDDGLFEDDDEEYDYVAKKKAKPKNVVEQTNSVSANHNSVMQTKPVQSKKEQSPLFTDPQKNTKQKPMKQASYSNSKIVNMNNSRGSEVYVIKPQEFGEAQIVTDFLKDGKTIVINMEGIELSIAQRIIDFIGGACYAVEGSLQAISNNIFIAAPSTIEVNGDLREEILNESTLSPNLGRY